MIKFTPLSSESDRKAIASNGIILSTHQAGRSASRNTDITFPYIILTLTLTGTGHGLYDMKDLHSKKNDLTVFLPGHIIRPLEYSDDYTQAWLIFDPSKFENSELKFNSKDLEFIYQAPKCHLTDEQAESLLAIAGAIQYIVSRSEEELPNKHRLLEAQLSIAYELYISIRREQDAEWKKDRMGHVYLSFCDLVVAHYKTERNVNFYAKQLGYDPRYFSKIFGAYNNGTSPLEWIQNYIATQAKRIMDDYPKQSVKETAFQLGFPTTANFCRYFKRATGMTPMEYKEKSAFHTN